MIDTAEKSTGESTLGISPTDFPTLQQAASRTSGDGQRWHFSLNRIELIALVAASALGALAFVVPHDMHTPFAIGTVLALLAALVSNYVGRQRKDDQVWFDGRAIAESIMSSSWRYMMRTAPFNDDATCNHVFTHQLVAILGARPELRHELHGSAPDRHQITAKMRQVRASPLLDRARLYRESRLLEQVDWYSAKAEANRVSASRWSWATLAAQLAALVAAIVAVSNEPDLDIIAILATVSASFTAWTQLRRHEDLTKSYSLAAQELLAISDLAEEITTEEDLASILDSAEGAISREHTLWVARHGSQLPT